MITAGFCLTVFSAEAQSQQIDRNAARAGRQQTEAIDSSVADLRAQVVSLQEANRDLLRRIDALAPSRADKQDPNPEQPRSNQESMTAQQADFQDWQELRQAIVQVVEPELQRLENRIAAIESRYAEHTHSYKSVPMGWANFMTAERWLETCPECLIAFRRPDGQPTLELETTGPSEAPR